MLLMSKKDNADATLPHIQVSNVWQHQWLAITINNMTPIIITLNGNSPHSISAWILQNFKLSQTIYKWKFSFSDRTLSLMLSHNGKLICERHKSKLLWDANKMYFKQIWQRCLKLLKTIIHFSLSVRAKHIEYHQDNYESVLSNRLNGPTMRYIPPSSDPANDIWAFPASGNEWVRYVSRIPNVYRTPSTSRLEKNDAIMTAQPHPPSGGNGGSNSSGGGTFLALVIFPNL